MKKMAIVVMLLVTIQSSYAVSFMEMIETYMANRAKKQEYRSLLIQKSGEEVKKYKLEEAINGYKAQFAEGNGELKKMDVLISKTTSIDELQKNVSREEAKMAKTDGSVDRIIAGNLLNFNKASLKIRVAEQEQPKKEAELRACNATIASLDEQLDKLRTQLGAEAVDALDKEDSFGRRLFSRVYDSLWFLPKLQPPRFKLVDGKPVAQ